VNYWNTLIIFSSELRPTGDLMSNHAVITPRGLNTDIVGLGEKRILVAGELTLGVELKVGSGGKARNIAQMAELPT
jgi:hypothetical protein